MKDPFSIHLENEDIQREKRKARDLRQSQWWKRRCSKGVCYYCGLAIPSKALTMDHIVPLSRGGKSTKNNIVPACKECNTKKKQLLLIEWEQYLEHIQKNISSPN